MWPHSRGFIMWPNEEIFIRAVYKPMWQTYYRDYIGSIYCRWIKPRLLAKHWLFYRVSQIESQLRNRACLVVRKSQHPP